MSKIHPAVFVDVSDEILRHIQYSVSAVRGLEGNNECIILMLNIAASEGSNPNGTS
jgi:hypothetical protein